MSLLASAVGTLTPPHTRASVVSFVLTCLIQHLSLLSQFADAIEAHADTIASIESELGSRQSFRAASDPLPARQVSTTASLLDLHAMLMSLVLSTASATLLDGPTSTTER